MLVSPQCHNVSGSFSQILVKHHMQSSSSHKKNIDSLLAQYGQILKLSTQEILCRIFAIYNRVAVNPKLNMHVVTFDTKYKIITVTQKINYCIKIRSHIIIHRRQRIYTLNTLTLCLKLCGVNCHTQSNTHSNF